MKHKPSYSKTAPKTAAKTLNHGFPYPVSYAEDFEIGKITHAKILLDLWKDFDDNTLDKGTHVFADTVRMDFSDGTSFEGKRDAFMDVMKAQRKTFTSFVSVINAIVSLKPKGKDESWACVWGQQTSVAAGKSSSVLINENWMFDKKGKVSYIRQFSAVPQPAV